MLFLGGVEDNGVGCGFAAVSCVVGGYFRFFYLFCIVVGVLSFYDYFRLYVLEIIFRSLVLR